MTEESQTGTLQVDVDITPEQLDRFYNAEFEIYIDGHEGASFHTLFNHSHYGIIGFSVYTCPPDCDLRIAYTRWEKEPHHEHGHYIHIKHDDWR